MATVIWEISVLIVSKTVRKYTITSRKMKSKIVDYIIAQKQTMKDGSSFYFKRKDKTMKLKDMITAMDGSIEQIFIKSEIGNSRFYDEYNIDTLTAQFREDTVKFFDVKELMHRRTLIVKLNHWS